MTTKNELFEKIEAQKEKNCGKWLILSLIIQNTEAKNTRHVIF